MQKFKKWIFVFIPQVLPPKECAELEEVVKLWLNHNEERKRDEIYKASTVEELIS